MKPTTAFDTFQIVVNADPEQLRTARSRRDAFLTALGEEDDVVEVFAAGSLRRGTQRAPINDVDVFVLFSKEEHEEWGKAGSSAHCALRTVADRVASLLGKEGSHVHLINEDGGTGTYVRLKRTGRHSLKCFIDDPGDGEGFTVDVVPALRHDERGLWIPERDLDDDANGSWIRTDPEKLIELVKNRQKEWEYWVPMVRMLKHWSHQVTTGMSSLYVEVLALEELPTDATRTDAVQRFFAAAEIAVSPALSDPAELCGPIQPDLDLDCAKEKIKDAAAASWKAVTAERDDRDDDAVCAWREVFGREFPEPPDGCKASSWHAEGIAPAIITPRRVKDSPQG